MKIFMRHICLSYIYLVTISILLCTYTCNTSAKNVDQKSNKEEILEKYNVAPNPDYNHHFLFEYHSDNIIYSEQEIELLQALQARNLELDNVEEKLTLSKRALQEYISKLEQKQNEIIEFTKTLEELINQDQEILNKKIEKLAKIYSNMEAKDVAKIFNELDIQDLLPIIKNMNEANLTQVFSAMKTEKVKLLTLEMMKSNVSRINN